MKTKNIKQISKGEWKIVDDNDTLNIVTNSTNVAIVTEQLSKEETLANARVIQYAPLLLEVAEEYFDRLKGTDAEKGLAFNNLKLLLEMVNSKSEPNKVIYKYKID
jgi:hypothetical protein